MIKEWFQNRIGQKVTRTNPIDFSTDVVEVTSENAGKLWLESEKGIRFEEKKTVIRVHQSPGDSTCISCEG